MTKQMKRMFGIILVIFLLSSMVACGQLSGKRVSVKIPESVKKTPKAGKEIKQTERKVTVNEADMFQTVIDRYQESLGLFVNELDFEKVSSYLYWTEQFDYVYDGAYYSQTDLDGDGVSELIVALGGKDSKAATKTIIDLYSVSDKGDLVRLSDITKQNRGPEVGEKVRMYLLKDGSLLLYAVGHYERLRINPERTLLVSEGKIAEPAESDYLDLSSLKWTKLEKQAPQPAPEETKTNRQEGMNIEAIQQGDFSSIAGVWENAQGNRVTIQSDGFVTYDGIEHTYFVDVERASISETGVLGAAITYYNPTNKPVASGSVPTVFVPKGAVIMSVADGGTDSTDINRDRFFSAQYVMPSDILAQEVYYRVD